MPASPVSPTASPGPRFFLLARAVWHTLPPETRRHAHAAATETAAAARSLADGASDGVEAAIDRISLLLGGKAR